MIPVVICILLFALILVWDSLRRRGKRLEREVALPPGLVKYVDADHTAKKLEKALVSLKFGLAGKPDYIVEQRGELIPVELKSREAKGPYPGEKLQLGAYCILVEDVYKKPVKKGLIKYKNSTYELKFDTQLKNEVLAVMDRMKEALSRGSVEGTPNPRRCRKCTIRDLCSYRAGDGS